MGVLIFIGVVTLLVLLSCEFAHWSVLGGHIKEADLDEYLGKYYKHLELNEFNKDGYLFSGSPKFIAYIGFAPTSKWYIKDYGTIPRWSKWSAKLDYKRKVLMATQESFINRNKKLSEL